MELKEIRSYEKHENILFSAFPLHQSEVYSTVLTGCVVIVVLPLSPCAVDAQKGFVVVILVPVEGGDPGKGPFCVATK